MTDISNGYFSITGITPLSAVKAGGKIHIIGVCGVAMAQLAIILSSHGYEVSGSDKEFYEPMGGLLASSRVRLLKGYRAENVPADADLVVIGNAVSRDHPEVQAAAEKKLCYSIFPRLLNELIIAGRHSIVVAGTHGKSTTTSLCASTLAKLGANPSYFIGGAANELPTSLAAGKGGVCVVEGDEYDSSFFAKVPKFRFYSPDTAIITSVEFDHADIYSNLAAVKEQFDWLAKSLSSSGSLICCLDDRNIEELLCSWRKTAHCSIVTYGKSEKADFRLVSTSQSGNRQEAVVRGPDSSTFKFILPLSGDYNALNALAVIISLRQRGFALPLILEALATFRGLKRRQDLRFSGPVHLVEDFAHHPTAVRETLSGIRKWFPQSRLIAVFEPRSNTSRRKVFQKEYVDAFKETDLAILSNVEVRSIDANQELLDVGELAEEIGQSGVKALSLPGAEEILKFLKAEIKEGDAIVLMSNGSFGGLPEELTKELEKRFPGYGRKS